MPKEPPLYLYFLALSLILLNALLWIRFIPIDRTCINNCNIYTYKALNVLPVAKDLPMREAIANIASSHGVDKRIALRVANCESHFNPKAKNKDSTAKGLWQILDIHGLSAEFRYDPIKSTRWAIDKWVRDGGCSAWECCKL